MTRSKIPPRLYCIPATQAPVVAVFRRGPTSWSHVGRWDLEQGQYEPGGWLRGRIFPRRSDLSPDGCWLCYFAHKPTATWDPGEAYIAVSKLPWLTALHAVGTCGTWTRGYYFSEKGGDSEAKALPIPYGLRAMPVIQFANERRRGWTETSDSPPQKDFWDQQRRVRLHKRQPGGSLVLSVESLGWPGGEFGIDQAVDGMRVRYWLETRHDIDLLADLQWADWDQNGQLLVATRDAKLQIWRVDAAHLDVVFEADLSVLHPHPTPAPVWAQHW